MLNRLGKRHDGGIYGYSITGFLHETIDSLTTIPPEFEPLVSNDEYDLINDAVHGGYSYVNKELNLNGFYCYDINSAYPYVLQNQYFRFPISKPIEINPEELDHKSCYIVRIVSNSEFGNGFFSNYELDAIKLMKIDFQIIRAWYFEHTICPKKMLGKFISSLYALKQDCEKFAKRVLRTIYGCSVQTNTTTIPVASYDPEKHLCTDFMSQTNKMRCINAGEGYYKHPLFSRMHPFLTGYARLMIIRQRVRLESFGFKIARVYTDSITCDCPPERFTMNFGPKIGEFKLAYRHDKDERYINKLILTPIV
jgi:hypothetical protein